MKEYELWLDESGDFKPKSQLKENRNPSLVGGVLIEKGKFSQKELENLVGGGMINPYSAHATEFEMRMKRDIALPALEKIIEAGGRVVYFENVERKANYSARELYLRLMATGLVQLMRTLGADQDEEFVLDVEIAQKSIPYEDLKETEWMGIKDVNYQTYLLPEEDYLHFLKSYLRNAWKENRFELNHQSRLNLSIMDARKELRLKLADYAANARLIRESETYEGIYGERLKKVFESQLLYEFRINVSLSRIETRMAIGDISGALLELYTGHGELNHTKMLHRIIRRMKDTSFRLARLQLEDFSERLVTYARDETDFEEVEKLINHVIGEAFPLMRESIPELQTDVSEFSLLLYLADMNLREGDILEAGPQIERMQELIRGMGYRIENLKHLYFFADKNALYYINCMDYQKAMSILDQSIASIENLQITLQCDDSIGKFYGNTVQMKSEYLGNALCMKIYAAMFLQRNHDELYPKLCEWSDQALDQYEYEGELERNLQYRSHIEMVAGHFEKALYFLLKSASIECEDQEKYENSCIDYLRKAMKEDPLSRAFYMMYYVELLLECQKNSDELVETLYGALLKEKKLMDLFFGEFYTSGLQSDSTRPVNIRSGVVHELLGVPTRNYHPMEVVLWKFADFMDIRNSHKRAKVLRSRAIEICHSQYGGKAYLGMNVTALAIRLAGLAIMMEETLRLSEGTEIPMEKLPELKDELKKLKKDLIGLDKKAPEKMAEYIEEVQDYVNRIEDAGILDVSVANVARRLADRIAY